MKDLLTNFSEGFRNRFLIKIALKIPSPILDKILLSFPFLYKSRFIRYESGAPQPHIELLIQAINETKNLQGDIIECGSNRCGTTSILAQFLKTNNIMKKIYALDSFSGFVPEEIQKERELGLTNFSENSYNYNSFSYVKRKVEKLKLSKIIILKKGFFHETLPTINSDFCVGFIDCDLAESMNFAAEKIWPHLVNNGILFFHDYGWIGYQNVKPTVDNFVKKHQNEIKWQKEIGNMFFVKKSI